jgi:hypothetical protein
MKLPYHFVRAPQALRKARMDNIAIVPASVLLEEKHYKVTTRTLRPGSVLLCRAKMQKTNQVLEKVAAYFEGHGHQVLTIPMEMMINRQAVI